MAQPRRHPYPTVARHNVRPASKLARDNERTHATNAKDASDLRFEDLLND